MQQVYLGYYYLETNQLQKASEHYNETYQMNINGVLLQGLKKAK